MVLDLQLGIGLDWMTPVGPLNFSLAYPITKKKLGIKQSLLDLI